MFDVKTNVSTKKQTEDGENIFFIALGNRFWLTANQQCQRTRKLFMTDLPSSGIHGKVINSMLPKVD